MTRVKTPITICGLFSLSYIYIYSKSKKKKKSISSGLINSMLRRIKTNLGVKSKESTSQLVKTV